MTFSLYRISKKEVKKIYSTNKILTEKLGYILAITLFTLYSLTIYSPCTYIYTHIHISLIDVFCVVGQFSCWNYNAVKGQRSRPSSSKTVQGNLLPCLPLIPRLHTQPKRKRSFVFPGVAPRLRQLRAILPPANQTELLFCQYVLCS